MVKLTLYFHRTSCPSMSWFITSWRFWINTSAGWWVQTLLSDFKLKADRISSLVTVFCLPIERAGCILSHGVKSELPVCIKTSEVCVCIWWFCVFDSALFRSCSTWTEFTSSWTRWSRTDTLWRQTRTVSSPHSPPSTRWLTAETQNLLEVMSHTVLHTCISRGRFKDLTGVGLTEV